MAFLTVFIELLWWTQPISFPGRPWKEIKHLQLFGLQNFLYLLKLILLGNRKGKDLLRVLGCLFIKTEILIFLSGNKFHANPLEMESSNSEKYQK